MRRLQLLLVFMVFFSYQSHCQKTKHPVPEFSFRVNGEIIFYHEGKIKVTDSSYIIKFNENITAETSFAKEIQEITLYRISISNQSDDTVDIENFVPYGEYPDHIYLTSTGPWALARAKLFLPDRGPIGVILPDNAWELGYGSVLVNDILSQCALARRTNTVNAESRRYRTIVYPGGSVEYTLWVSGYTGEWQNGLKLMFHNKWLYDLENFNDSLYRRDDLRWIRHAYLVGLQFAWNKQFYDWQRKEYTVDHFLEEGKSYFGGYDVIGLWPTWPRLGVDQRNQWDLFSDLPGGLEQIKSFSQQWKQGGTRFFVCYNPWDESTRTENPYEGMASLIEATDADGVVLDCHGASSHALQKAADSIKPGVVMYSEGMAVVKDMPGIVAGRVHDAIYLPPPLNLNKLIRPDFAIFRVCQLRDGRIKREASIALFNGYGTELNTFAPGRAESMEDDLFYLGRTTRILRENSDCFLSSDWTPLIRTIRDSIWVNKWPTAGKTIYTVLSMVPEGFQGNLFCDDLPDSTHLVSLWHHEELDGIERSGKIFIPVTVEAFNSYDLGTRAEGNIDCIAVLPSILSASLREGFLLIDCHKDAGDEIRIWKGMPSYLNKSSLVLEPGSHAIRLNEHFGDYEGKVVVQLFDDQELIDERVVKLEAGTPRLMNQTYQPNKYSGVSVDYSMAYIPGGTFQFRAENTDQFIPYPGSKDQQEVKVKPYYMDIFPVTNAMYKDFISNSGYIPSDTVNYLRHWVNGEIPEGLETHPVVYVSFEDAKAYADWLGLRLPTEIEWQFAAQGSDGRQWPWGNEYDSTLCNNAEGKTSSVDAFPGGKSPFGIMDMTGNVWQMTNDVYNNGTYYFVIMKGGSFYKPTSSWWYVKGGPQPNTWHQQLLLVSPGFDRNSTVGFRCVKDAMK